MSKSSLRTTNELQHEHGTTKAYIIGFILSLIFTLIPYYLVVKQTVSGTTLLATILSFAVAQMIIQVTFFLHLGRGPKPKWNLFFFVATIGIVLVVVGGSILIINNLHYNMQPSDQTKKLIADEGIYQVSGELTGACQVVQTNHKVMIKNGHVSPLHTTAHKCDTLTFINQDNLARKIAFGIYPEHQAYGGEIDLSITKGYNQTITLSEPGTYKFYDRLHTKTIGDFTVSAL